MAGTVDNAAHCVGGKGEIGIVDQLNQIMLE